jgi:hypothetical protein
MDIQRLKEQVDLLALAEQHTQVRRVASTNGGEWAGPCPFCGGRDRFRLQPQHPAGGRWMCRGCTSGKWQDAIAFGQRLWPGLSFRQVCEQLAEGRLPERPGGAGPVPAPDNPAYVPPGEDWQAVARRAIQICQEQLWQPHGAPALDYLRRRGLKDETIRSWSLGYSPGARFDDSGRKGGQRPPEHGGRKGGQRPPDHGSRRDHSGFNKHDGCSEPGCWNTYRSTAGAIHSLCAGDCDHANERAPRYGYRTEHGGCAYRCCGVVGDG